MILKVFTKGEGPETRHAHELAERIEGEGFEVEYFDAEDHESTQLVELYDIYSYPAFFVTREDGTLVEQWKGSVPLEADVKMFLSQ